MNEIKPIVITGFMGCGKTEVARALARRLAVETIDLDEFITSQTGRTPARLIDEDGETVFRNIEFEALTNILQKTTVAVLSLGGGAWIESRNRDVLANAGSVVVWLDTPFSLCWSRIEATPGDRPLGRTKEQAHELYQRRLAIYQLATVQVQTTANETADEIAARIEAEVKSSPLFIST